jgi:hypothetical protein
MAKSWQAGSDLVFHRREELARAGSSRNSRMVSMSLCIDVDRITSVLLADGWHEVYGFSFDVDCYEMIQHHPDKDRNDNILLTDGMGAMWLESKGTATMYCKVSSILALKRDDTQSKKAEATSRKRYL